MSWIKLNHNAPRHPKVAALSNGAFRVWIESLCYAAEFLTDGHVPWGFLCTVPEEISRELLEFGLWIDTAGVVTIHDYLRHQTSKSVILAERERNAHRKYREGTEEVPQKYRESTKEVPQKYHGIEDRTKKVRTPPISPSKEGDRRKRKHTAADPWQQRDKTEEVKRLMRDEGLSREAASARVFPTKGTA